MTADRGRIVQVTAGKERDRFFVIVCSDDNYVYIADGKKRKLESLKRKNLKHLRFTDKIIDMNDITDKKLRIVLGNLSTP